LLEDQQLLLTVESMLKFNWKKVLS
jgi:hypothetical protein